MGDKQHHQATLSGSLPGSLNGEKGDCQKPSTLFSLPLYFRPVLCCKHTNTNTARNN